MMHWKPEYWENRREQDKNDDSGKREHNEYA